MLEKRPRAYAQGIIALPTRAERAEALKKVPEHLQELVKAHVVNAYNLKKYAKTP